MKSDGSYTYFAGDVAYHYDKLQRGYQHLVNVFGADHIGYIPRMLAVVAAFTGGTVERDAKGKLKYWHTQGGSADLAIKVVNLVKLFKNGEPYKMSKRAGTFVTLRDVVDEVGRDPVRFMMLYRKELEPLDFDFAKVMEQSKDNPVFYVQYAHARAASVFRNAQEVFPELAPRQPRRARRRPHEADGCRRNRADQEAGVFPAFDRRSGARRGAASARLLSL